MYTEIQIQHPKKGHVDLFVLNDILERLIGYYEAIGFSITEYSGSKEKDKIYGAYRRVFLDEIEPKERIYEMMGR